MACKFPLLVQNPAPTGFSHIPVGCGKCYDCKKTTLSHWAFRLRKEDERAIKSHFVTLTYDTRHVPLSEKGLMTLRYSDVQKFMKRLRIYHSRDSRLAEQKEPIRYFVVGEYGSLRNRPHYHIIIFNADLEMIEKAWTQGQIHFGQVSGASVAYTLKYLDKDTKIPMFPGDDRVKEFRKMSKGMGENYLTPEMVRWHQRNPLKNYVLQDGFKISLPRFYRERIFTPEERNQQNNIFSALAEKAEFLKEEQLQNDKSSATKNIVEYERQNAQYRADIAAKKAKARNVD